jgi:hypothetical protein
MGCVRCGHCEKIIDLDFIDAIEHEGEFYHDTCLMEAGLEELERIEE